MPNFTCPRCSQKNKYICMPKSEGYARCSSCNIALLWKNKEGELKIEKSFIPDWCTVSPKTNHILGPEVGYKMPKSVLKIYALLRFPGAQASLRRRKIRSGTLKRE